LTAAGGSRNSWLTTPGTRSADRFNVPIITYLTWVSRDIHTRSRISHGLV